MVRPIRRYQLELLLTDVSESLRLHLQMEASNDPEFINCYVCLNTWEDPYTIPCGHTFCKGCIDQLQSPKCPICRGEFTHGQEKELFIFKKLMKQLRYMQDLPCEVCGLNGYRKYSGIYDKMVCSLCYEIRMEQFRTGHYGENLSQVRCPNSDKCPDEDCQFNHSKVSFDNSNCDGFFEELDFIHFT